MPDTTSASQQPDPRLRSKHSSSAKAELQSFFRGFVYAFRGVAYTVKTQRNMRVHIFAAILAVVAGALLKISLIEFGFIAIAILSVLVSEMFNTVIETCVDLISPEYHPLAERAKDVAAGAVLVNAGMAVIIGIIVFAPPLISLFTKL